MCFQNFNDIPLLCVLQYTHLEIIKQKMILLGKQIETVVLLSTTIHLEEVYCMTSMGWISKTVSRRKIVARDILQAFLQELTMTLSLLHKTPAQGMKQATRK